MPYSMGAEKKPLLLQCIIKFLWRIVHQKEQFENPPNKMPLSILTESRSIRLSGVNRFPVSVAHRQVHLHANNQKVSLATMSPTLNIDFHISDGFTNTMTIRKWITKLSWLVQVPNLRSQICSSNGNQVIST